MTEWSRITSQVRDQFKARVLSGSAASIASTMSFTASAAGFNANYDEIESALNNGAGLNHDRGGRTQEPLKLFGEMGREPLVKEILGEVRQLSEEERGPRIKKLVDSV